MSVLLESLLDHDAVANASRPPQPEWLTDLRAAAAKSLAREGLPGPRTEAWKYTSLRALEQRAPVVGDAGASGRAIDASTFALPLVDGPRLVFVNGVYRPDLSDAPVEAGLSLSTLASAKASELEQWRAALTRESRDAAAFTQLNTMLATDGPIVHIAGGTRIARPVHLVFISAGTERDFAWHARALIDIGAGAAVKLIEHHVGSGSASMPNFGNVVAQYVLGIGAQLELVQIQEGAAGTTLIRRSEFALAERSMLATHTLELGAQLTRHDIDVDLAGRGARFVSRGVFALRGRQHADTHMDVRHQARDTASDIVWRGVADERARGVFHGAITVAAGADGADANLSNKNLLLSPHAEIDTQPVLEIYADEVKAAHGATVGQLDERALFYLRSRGLPLDAARRLLIAAFCGAVIADVPLPELRDHLDAMLAARLEQN